MPNEFSIGDRVVIERSILSYLIGRRGTVIGGDGDNYEVELDEPMKYPDGTTAPLSLRWFSPHRLALLDPLAEENLSIEFSFDSLIGE